MTTPPAILGWDIGGVNTKVARLRLPPDTAALQTNCLPYEIKNRPEALAATLIQAATSVGSQPEDLHAVTMTAELSQAFHTKGEGVAFVLDSIGNAFPGRTIYVYSVDGFVTTDQARRAPLALGRRIGLPRRAWSRDRRAPVSLLTLAPRRPTSFPW